LKKIQLIFLGLILVSLIARTDGNEKLVTLSGYVKDASTGERLIGASVFIKELSMGMVTNMYGFYSLSVKPGRYHIQFSYVGYSILEKEYILDANTHENIELSLEQKEIEEVVVKAEKADANIKRLEMSTNKMDIKTIQRIPALMGEVDILKAIQLLPGVQSTSEGTSNFSVRGGSYDQNLILLDEATVYNASHLMGFFSVFNNDVIQDIKLYKGDLPASAGGRLSSLLDVRMREGNNRTFSGSGGIGSVSSRLTLEGPIVKDKCSFIISGRRTYLDIFTPLAKDEQLKNSHLYFYDLNDKMNVEINQNNRISISAYLGRDVFKNSFANLGFGNQTLSGRWNHLFNQKLFSNLTFVNSIYDYDLGFSETGATGFNWISRMKEIGLKEDLNWYPNPNNTVNFGIQSYYHTLNPGEVSSGGVYPTYVLPSSNALEHAAYISNEQILSDRWSVKYGLRYSLFQNLGEATVYHINSNYVITDSSVYAKGKIYNFYGGLEPRLGIKYEINEVSSAKLSYSRTRQYMQLASNSNAGTPLDIWFFSSPNVKPQVADQIATGYFRNLFDNKLQTSVEFYYKQMQNTIDFRDHAMLYLNQRLEGELRFGHSKAYGMELLLQVPDGRLNGWVSYTLSHTERTIQGINSGNPYVAPYDKPNSVNIVSSYRLSKKIDLSAAWIYATGTPSTFPTGRFIYGNLVLPVYSARNAYRLPDYHRLDISMNLKGKEGPKRLWHGEWNFSIYNVYARKNAWAIQFVQDPKNPQITYAQKIYLFSIVPSITYNFKF
jgi:CarboxypepD_reg-like domain/TonB-dependent Receptor Plug Domain